MGLFDGLLGGGGGGGGGGKAAKPMSPEQMKKYLIGPEQLERYVKSPGTWINPGWAGITPPMNTFGGANLLGGGGVSQPSSPSGGGMGGLGQGLMQMAPSLIGMALGGPAGGAIGAGMGKFLMPGGTGASGMWDLSNLLTR